ncbi:hypothetical protein [Streptomyces sp. N35]|uniref:hypothetical protein n=1 Tax=Streptomyces sp. N35 TaxID=2795730 RepID=UPI0018F4956F|nr:hypothetical protein [Streptomyces sp. N35]
MNSRSHLETASALTAITADLTGVGGIGWHARERRRQQLIERARALEAQAGALEEVLGGWHGRSARPVIPALQSVMQRLAGTYARPSGIEQELYPNCGSSLRDAVDRLEARHQH